MSETICDNVHHTTSQNNVSVTDKFLYEKRMADGASELQVAFESLLDGFYSLVVLD